MEKEFSRGVGWIRLLHDRQVAADRPLSQPNDLIWMSCGECSHPSKMLSIRPWYVPTNQFVRVAREPGRRGHVWEKRVVNGRSVRKHLETSIFVRSGGLVGDVSHVGCFGYGGFTLNKELSSRAPSCQRALEWGDIAGSTLVKPVLSDS